MTSNNPNAATAAAGAGKKGKIKNRPVELNEFLNTKGKSWAEEMEDQPLPADPEHTENYSSTVESRSEILQKRTQLPSAPKAVRGSGVDLSRVPDAPPFNAYIGNISYEADENTVEHFFQTFGIRTSSVRLMRDGSRIRGYGYVEFATREDLIEAFETANNQRLLNREIKLDIVQRNDDRSPQQQTGYNAGRGGRQQRPGYDSGANRDREQETSGDWRQGNRPTGPPPPQPSYGGYEDDRRSQTRTAPPFRPMQPGQNMPLLAGGGAPPMYDARPQTNRGGYSRPQGGGYQQGPQQAWNRSGYDSDYGGGGGGGGYPQRGGQYENYPLARQASYSSNYSGYGSDREGGSFQRGPQQQQYNQQYRYDRPPLPPHQNRNDYQGGAENYQRYQGPPQYNNYPQYGDQQPRDYPEGGNFRPPHEGYNRQQQQYNTLPMRSRGGGAGYDRRPSQREAYDDRYAGRRREERMSSVDTVDGVENTEKKRQPLKLEKRSVPSVSEDASAQPPSETDEQQDAAPIRGLRTSASASEVFCGARPVDTAAREREIEEKLQRQKEELLRDTDEERKAKQQQQPQRLSQNTRRRTSDSYSSNAGTGSVKDQPIRETEEQNSGQVKILQRAHTLPSDGAPQQHQQQPQPPVQEQHQQYAAENQGHAEGHQDHYRRGGQQQNQRPHKSHHYQNQHFQQQHQHQHQQQQQLRPAPPPQQNAWTSKSRQQQQQQQQPEQLSEFAEQQKQGNARGFDQATETQNEQQQPANVGERQGDSEERNKSTEGGEEEASLRDEDQNGVQRKPPLSQGSYGGGQRNSFRGARGGRGGRRGAHYDHQVPPRFARRGSQHDDASYGQEPRQQQPQHDQRRGSKGQIIITRGGKGTLPNSGRGARGGSRPQRPSSRDRDLNQKSGGNYRQQQQRRGSSDSSFSTQNKPQQQQHEEPQQPKQQDEEPSQTPSAASHGRRNQGNASQGTGSRKGSTVASTVLEPSTVSFATTNKFGLLDTEASD